MERRVLSPRLRQSIWRRTASSGDERTSRTRPFFLSRSPFRSAMRARKRSRLSLLLPKRPARVREDAFPPSRGRNSAPAGCLRLRRACPAYPQRFSWGRTTSSILPPANERCAHPPLFRRRFRKSRGRKPSAEEEKTATPLSRRSICSVSPETRLPSRFFRSLNRAAAGRTKGVRALRTGMRKVPVDHPANPVTPQRRGKDCAPASFFCVGLTRTVCFIVLEPVENFMRLNLRP